MQSCQVKFSFPNTCTGVMYNYRTQRILVLETEIQWLIMSAIVCYTTRFEKNFQQKRKTERAYQEENTDVDLQLMITDNRSTY